MFTISILVKNEIPLLDILIHFTQSQVLSMNKGLLGWQDPENNVNMLEINKSENRYPNLPFLTSTIPQSHDYSGV